MTNFECDVLGCSVKKIIECMKCKYKSCIKCTQTFILSQTKAECMNCHQEYTEDYLRTIFTKSWMTKEYVDWKKSKLEEREKSYLPETVEYIEQEKRKNKISILILETKQKQLLLKTKCKELKQTIKSKESEVKKAKKNIELQTIKQEELKELKDLFTSSKIEYEKSISQYNILKRSIDSYVVRHNIDNSPNYKTYTIEKLIEFANSLIEIYGSYENSDIYGLLNQSDDLNKQKESSFIKPCPASDCRGFINNKWICGLCETVVCKDCHEIKGKKKEIKEEEEEKYNNDIHICDPNNIETAKALQKETKGCPKCGIRIFKISGCDQMYCTGCHTAFSWKTGKVETGIIHNPHYFQYLRENNLDIPRFNHPDANPDNRGNNCENVGSVRDIERRIIDKTTNITFVQGFTFYDFKLSIDECIRIRNHIIAYTRDNNFEYNPNLNRDLRIKYLNKHITNETWKSTIMRRYKKLEYEKTIHNIKQTLIAVFGDFINNTTLISNTILSFNYFQPILNFINYYNSEVEKYSKLFNYKSYKVLKVENNTLREPNIVKQNINSIYIYRIKEETLSL